MPDLAAADWIAGIRSKANSMHFSSITAARLLPAMFIVAALLALSPASGHAELLPSFIRVLVLNAATGSAVQRATVSTTTGFTQPVQNGPLRVPPNVYDLILSAPGFRSNMATAIFAGPGQTATVTVLLAQASTNAGTLRGRVTALGNSDPIPGALVFTDLGAIAVTDKNGYFTAVGPSGAATVTVAAQKYSARIIKNVNIPAAGLRGISARLARSAEGLNGIIYGAVRDACTGRQLAGINITSSNENFLITADGTYQITAPPGTTALLACGEGYQCGLQTATLGFIPFAAVANFSLVPLEQGIGRARGSITDAQTGLPVAGARIATDTQDITFSDSEGEYSLRATPCASLLSITRQGYLPYSAAVTITAGGTAELDAALEPLTSCHVSGTVRNLFTGLPVDGVQLIAESAGAGAAMTDETGFYSLSMSSCACVITVCADGFFKARRLVFSTVTDNINLNIRLIPCPICRCEPAASTILMPESQ